MKEVGQLYGLEVAVCLTNMHQPLGKKAGLWCEVVESIDCLKGDGPNDLMEIIYHLGSQALKLSGENNPLKKLQTAILDGSALNTFKEMIERHGGSASSLDLFLMCFWRFAITVRLCFWSNLTVPVSIPSISPAIKTS